MLSLSLRRKEALADPKVNDTLQLMRDGYESNFGHSSKMSEIGPIKYMGIGEIVKPIDEFSALEHWERMGIGSTAEEAMADWKRELDKCPQSGSKLVWRVPPEIECYCDFPSDKLVWRVYARFTIVL